MTWLFDTNALMGFLQSMARIGALFGSLPILSDRWVPVRVRVVIVVCLAVVFTGVLPNTSAHLSGIAAAVAIFQEVALGLLVGLVLRLGLAAVQGAGNVVALQMGIGLRGVIDPGGGMKGSIVAGLLYLAAGAVWVGLDMHHDTIRALAWSFRELPPGTWDISPECATVLVGATGRMFVASFSLLAPVLATMLLANLMVGFIAKTAPRMNMLVVGFPVLIGMGLLALGTTVLLWGRPLRGLFEESLRDVGRIMGLAAG